MDLALIDFAALAHSAVAWVIENPGAAASAIGLPTGLLWAWRFNVALNKATEIHRSTFYSELDRLYFDLLSLAIEHPHLRTPERIGKHDELALQLDYEPYPTGHTDTAAEPTDKAIKAAQYEAYALMVWNFLETLHDRCEEYPDLLDTWAPVVSAENRAHRGWFLKQMREEKRRELEDPGHEPSHKFCEEFRVFVHDKNFLPVKSSSGEYHYPRWSYEGRRRFWKEPNFGALAAGPPPQARIVPREQKKTGS